MDLFILNTSRNYYSNLWIVLNSFINIYLKYTTQHKLQIHCHSVTSDQKHIIYVEIMI